MENPFSIIKEDNKTSARVGKLKTAHGIVNTPCFMPLATKATAKYIDPKMLEEITSDAIICNSFVLSMKPGSDSIEKAGGLHKFMNFKHSIFTDCGAFQMLRPSFYIKTTDEGILFNNPFDGKKILLTPAESMRIQNILGTDVAMCLDNVPAYKKNEEQDYSHSLKCTNMTHRWAEECRAHKEKLNANGQLLFGICQGGFFPELRKKSAQFMDNLGFDGMAIGGLCIGEPIEQSYELLRASTLNIDKHKCRYLMGIGNPRDLLEFISRGIDVFDSAFPTQNARHDTLFTWEGKLFIDKSQYKEDFTPIDEKCNCYVCKKHTRAYIHFLSKVKEPAAQILKSYHNLYFLQELMAETRTAILEGRFEKFKEGIEQKFRN